MIRALAFIWLGMVLGVSFLATPVKFQAPSLTLPVALDVGRSTFHVFGKVEWALSLALVVAAIVARSSMEPIGWVLVAGVVGIVAAETLFLIPRLDLRVEAIIGGATPPASRLHLVYVIAEGIKAAALLAVGVWAVAGHG